MLEFGSNFKKSRESLNVSLDKIAAETRISARLLAAIENEQFELLPGGIFNRGFIRTYAERLGLDPEAAIREYEKLVRATETEPVRHETERVTGQTTKIPVYYVALAGLLALVVIYYFLTHRTEHPLVPSTVPVSASPSPGTGDVPVSQSALIPAPEETSVVEAAKVPSPESVTSAPPATRSPAISPVTAQTTSASGAPVVIDLEVREETWFKLSSDGTDVVKSEVLPPGTVRRYTASSSMDVSIGNAAGLVFRVNGQPVPSLGRSGQVRSMTITPTTSAASLVAH
jgi:cytoskeleton protein RodZ